LGDKTLLLKVKKAG